MSYKTQPITETMLTIPPRYVQNESQWARQICVHHRWRLSTATGEIFDEDGRLLADSLHSLTQTLVILGWIVPREDGEPQAGIAWTRIPDEAESAVARLVATSTPR
ncbi:MAG: hypothetical protein L0G59_10340 [Kocuria sp.]|nr:hypothetical protein [Kocuria sp.]MDN5617164.1 hypothetical protein [Kocuria sp.]